MQPANFSFHDFRYWANNSTSDMSDVLDLARCLEDIAFACLNQWHFVKLQDEKPTTDVFRKAPRYKIVGNTGELSNTTGWIGRQLKLPYLAKMIDQSALGKWHIDVNSYYVYPLYCNEILINDDLFLGHSIDLCDFTGDGDLPWISIKVDTHHKYPLTLQSARVSFTGLKEYNDLVHDVSLSLRSACHLLSKENYRNNLYMSGKVDLDCSRIDENERMQLISSLCEAASTINMQAAVDMDWKKFIDSLKHCREKLSPLADFAKRFTIYLIGHAHIDLAWKWRWPETIECMKGTIENQLELMDKYPGYVFVESSAAVWKALAEQYPGLWNRCREACERGQFEPAGGMWCEPDVQCVGAESLVHQLLYGQEEARKLLGRESSYGFNIDAFGFNAALPKIYKSAGMNYFITQKLRYNEFTLFPYTHFWWESDDGSRILGLHVYPSHMHLVDPDDMPSIVRINHLTSGVFDVPIMFGYGNHGGGPVPEMLRRIEEWKHITVYPRLEYSGFDNYFQQLERRDPEVLNAFPVIKDELFLETHHKTFSVQGKVKEANRECERQLLGVESLAAVAVGNGYNFQESNLDLAWQRELFNQFHDILPGSSIPSVYQDVFDDYERAFADIAKARKVLSEQMLGCGDTQYIFNPLPWQRDAVVTIDGQNLGYSGYLMDTRGNIAEYQRMVNGDVVFVAENLPALGFEVYKPVDLKTDSNKLKSGDTWAENRHYKVSFNAAKGVIDSLVVDGTDVAGDGIGCLMLLDDPCLRDYKSWNFGFSGKKFEPVCESFEKIEDGPVRVVFRAKYSFGIWEKKKPYYGEVLWHTPGVKYPTSFFTQDFIIYAGSNRIECVFNADWWEDDIVLKVLAETSLKNTRAFCSIPFGMIERPTTRNNEAEKAKYEVPAGVWTDLFDKDAGLAILNRSRHGYNAEGCKLGLTLLTSPHGADRASVPDPLVDRGRHIIEYAFYPHSGDYEAAKMHRYAAEYEYPIILLNGHEKTKVPMGVEMLKVDPDCLMVSGIKPAEDNAGIIVRLFEPYGHETSTKLSGKLIENDKRLVAVDTMERDIERDLKKLGPHEIQTIRIKP